MEVKVKTLEGQIIKSIRQFKNNNNGDTLEIVTSNGRYLMMNEENSFGCNISTVLEEVIGDFNDLINTPILLAEERSSSDNSALGWTFYEFKSIKGSVTLRWMAQNEIVDYLYSTEVKLYKE